MHATAPVRDRILDAAVEVAADHGLARLSVGDVAKRAGLSRQTLYKYFSSKEALVAAAVLREAGAIAEQVITAADRHDDPRRSLEAAITTTLVAAGDHPLLARLMQTEPEALLPLLVGGSGPVGTAVTGIVEQIVARRIPTLSPSDARLAADLLSRLLVSYAVNPPDQPPEVVAAFVADLMTLGLNDAARHP